MKKIAPIVVASALTAWVTPAIAELWVLPGIVNPEYLPSVAVRGIDDAKDGCWTNIGEVQAYATDGITGLGYKIVDTNALPHMYFDFIVSSFRLDGVCFGTVTIELRTFDDVLGGKGQAMAVLAENGTAFFRYENANHIVMDFVKEMIDEMREHAKRPDEPPK